jgi:hypothetical protein
MHWSEWLKTPNIWDSITDGWLCSLAVLLDALMSLATAGLFAYKRTLHIKYEWICSSEKQRP